MTERAYVFGRYYGDQSVRLGFLKLFLNYFYVEHKGSMKVFHTVIAKSHQSTWRRSHHHWKLWQLRAWGPAGWGRGQGGCRMHPSVWVRPPVSHWPLWKTPGEQRQPNVHDMWSESPSAQVSKPASCRIYTRTARWWQDNIYSLYLTL